MKISGLTICAAILTGIGLLFIYSSSHMGIPGQSVPGHFFVARQAIFLGAALTCFAVVLHTPIEFWDRFALVFYGMAVLVIIAVMVPGIGVKVNGAQRWLGLGPFRFQPSEFAKLALVMYLARVCSRAGDMIREDFKVDLIVMTTAFVLVVLVGVQPDFGTAMVMTGLTFGFLLVSGIPRVRIAAFTLVTSPLIFAALISTPYRRARLLAFLDPWTHKQEIGYQLVQSFIAIGSGGLWGRGLGLGDQKRAYLPESHTDFVFSVVGEELGFAGAAFVVLTFATFGYFGYRVALEAKTPFARFMAFGLVALIVGSALFNIAVAVGLLPTKGMVLPFMSYGGTALVSMWIAVGILERIRYEEVVQHG